MGIRMPFRRVSMNDSDVSGYDSMRNLRWSPAEKAFARKAFDLALHREFAAIIAEARKMMAGVEQVSALWDLEQYLTERRKEIDRRYDYRYSVLPVVFGNLISEGRLSEGELRGLGEDKLKFIRVYAKS
jgi:Photoprotection regulator fluorescence recovery protein